MKQKSYHCCPKIIAQPNDERYIVDQIIIYEWRRSNGHEDAIHALYLYYSYRFL